MTKIGENGVNSGGVFFRANVVVKSLYAPGHWKSDGVAVGADMMLKSLNTLGHCANRGAYAYSEDDVRKIFAEIDSSVKAVKAKFHYPKRKEFSL